MPERVYMSHDIVPELGLLLRRVGPVDIVHLPSHLFQLLVSNVQSFPEPSLDVGQSERFVVIGRYKMALGHGGHATTVEDLLFSSKSSERVQHGSRPHQSAIKPREVSAAQRVASC